MSHLKEEDNFWAVGIPPDKVRKGLVEDDLLLPLRDDRLVLLEVKWLRHDG